MDNDLGEMGQPRRRPGLLELSIMTAVVCVSAAIVTLAFVGASAGT